MNVKALYALGELAKSKQVYKLAKCMVFTDVHKFFVGKNNLFIKIL